MVNLSKEVFKEKLNIFIRILKDEKIYLNTIKGSEEEISLNIKYDSLLELCEKDAAVLFGIMDKNRTLTYDGEKYLGLNREISFEEMMNNDNAFYALLLAIRFLQSLFIFDKDKVREIAQKYFNALNN